MDRIFSKLLCAICCLIACSGQAYAEVKVDVDLATEFNESEPLSGTVIVSHPSSEAVDIKSFKLDNHPLQVELQKEEPMTTGDLTLSFYRFTQSPQPKGIYILPRIKVRVGKQDYQSIPRTYVIKQGRAPQTPSPANRTPPSSAGSYQPPPPASSAAEQFLKLEAFVNGPQELYPSQRTVVGYRYFYNVNIETTREILPLLDAEGFIKIGDKTIKQEENGGINAQQVEQTIEAHKPGEYDFGPSFLDGRPYTTGPLGQRTYGSQSLTSTVPAVKIQVLPFPEAGKPPSFKGALGNFIWKVSLNSPSAVHVGDEVKLLIEVTGAGNLDSVNLPELCCQPGMSGLFSLSDLPAVGQISDDTKRFDVKLRPLSTSLKAIPSFEFSSFDPDTRSYVTSTTDSILLNVMPSKQEGTPSIKPNASSATRSSSESVAIPAEVMTPQAPPLQAEAAASAIEIESLYPLKSEDLENLTLGTWWSLLLIPFGLAAILFQLNISKYLEEMKLQPKALSGAQVLANAEAAPAGSTERYFLISQALLMRLEEMGLIPSSNIAPEALSSEGLTGKVRTFLCDMQEKRYTGQQLKEEILISEAKALFEELQNSGGKV